MKTLKNLSLSILASAVLFTSCKKEDLPLKTIDFHYKEMGQNFIDKFGSDCVGMQYTIMRDNEVKAESAFGLRVLPVDGAPIPYTTINRKSVHSCSKTITAATLVSVLEENGIPIDSSIYHFLPASWPKDPKVKDINFHQLLVHISGLRGTRDSYSEMKNYMAAGNFKSKNSAVPLNTRYANVNYTLMRFLIPMIDNKRRADLNALLFTGNSIPFEQASSKLYIDLVRSRALVPSGVSNEVAPKIWGNTNGYPTKNYNFSDQSISGYEQPDQTYLTGAGGWYLNTNELSAFIYNLHANNLQYVDAAFMKSKGSSGYGMYKKIKDLPSKITYYTHNGAFADNSGRGGYCIWIYVPVSNITIAVQVNSRSNNFNINELEKMIIEAYWESYY